MGYDCPIKQKESNDKWQKRFEDEPDIIAFRSFSTGKRSHVYRMIATRLISFYRAEKTDSTIVKSKHYRDAVAERNACVNLYWRPAIYLSALGLLKQKKRVRTLKSGKTKTVIWGFEITELGMKHDVYDIIADPGKFGFDHVKHRNR